MYVCTVWWLQARNAFRPDTTVVGQRLFTAMYFAIAVAVVASGMMTRALFFLLTRLQKKAWEDELASIPGRLLT